MHRWAGAVAVIAWTIFLMGPLGFVITGTTPSGDWLAGIYAALAPTFDARIVRWIFGGLWFALNAALFWHLVLSRRRRDDLGDQLDLDD